MKKIFDKINLEIIIRLVLSYLLSIILYQVVFKNADILTLFTNNNTGDFLLGGWPILWLITFLIFALISFFPKKQTIKNNIVIFLLLLLSIFFGKLQSFYFVFEIIIFSFILISLVDIDSIKSRLGDRKIDIILNIAIGFILFLYFYIPIMNHLNFRESGLDMGIYQQAIWKYAHFKYPVNTLDHYWGIKNILGDHFELILPLISPIFWIFNSIIVLHIFNGLIIALGSYFLYLLGKLKLKNNTILAKMAVLIFLAFAGLQMAFMEGQFHPLSYVPVLIILIVYFIEKKKWWAYLISLIVLLSIKESMGLYAVFIGVYIFLYQRKYWKVALFTASCGVIHYLVTVWAVTTISGIKYLYFNYGRLGEGSGQVLKTIITNPLYALYVFFSPIGKIETLSLILGSFGFLVFAPPLIIGIPMFAERFLTSDQHIWHFYMHYNTPLAGVLICALIFFFSNKYIRSKVGVFSLMIFVLLATFLININYRSDIVRFFYKIKANVIVDQNFRDINSAAKIIPKDASVSTQDALVTHFASRDRIYQFPVNFDADYIIASSAKGYWLLNEKEFKDFLNNSIKNGYGIRFLKNKVVVLQKGYKGEISEIPESFFTQN